MIQRSLFNNNEPVQTARLGLGASQPAMDTTLPVANTAAHTIPNQTVDSTGSGLNGLNGSASPLLQMLPLIVQLLQAVVSLIGMSQGNQGNPFNGSLNSTAPGSGNSSPSDPSQASAPAKNPPSPSAPTTNPAPDTQNNPPNPAANPPNLAANPSNPAASPTNPATDTQNNPSGPAGATAVSATQPPNSIDVKKLGAKGDGSTDDQAILQKAIAQAKSTGESVWLPPGTYNHSGVLNLEGVKMSGAGNQSVLHATNPNQAAIELSGSKSALSNVKVTSNASTRIPNAAASDVWVNHANGATVSGVTAVGAGANSITLDGAMNSTVNNVVGVGSNADGIAVLNGSQHNVIANSVVRQAGDDSFSDDSYTSDATPDSDNKFLNDTSVDNRYGDNFKLAGANGDLVDHSVSIGGPKGGVVVIQDNASGTKASTNNVVQNSVAIGLTAPTVSAFMNPGGSNNQYFAASDPAAKQYIDEAAKTANEGSFNSEYVAGTGPGANNSGGNHLYT